MTEGFKISKFPFHYNERKLIKCPITLLDHLFLPSCFLTVIFQVFCDSHFVDMLELKKHPTSVMLNRVCDSFRGSHP